MGRLTIVFLFIMVYLMWSSFGWCSAGEDVECVADYTTHRLTKFHSTVKELELIFNETKFVLHLMPDQSLITSHTNILFVNESDLSAVVNASKYAAWRYGGHVNNDIDNSEIFCVVDDQGYLHGSFIYEDVIYLIEPSQSTLYDGPAAHVNSEDYEAILYKSTDVFKCQRTDSTCNATAVCRYGAGSWLGTVEGESSKHAEVKTRKRRPAENVKSIICDVRIAVDFPYFKHVAQSERDLAVASVVNLMRRVDTLFRQLDFNQDGQAENLGFFIREIQLYLDPVSKLDNSTTFRWDPVQFFTDMKRYNFSDVCAGILFTYRKMQSSEEFGPSIIKSTFDSTDLGICSTSSMSIPSAVMDNYGSFIGNAVPVNFMRNGRVFREKEPKHMVIQVAHQLAQLFGAPTDDDTTRCNTTDPSKMNIMAYPPPPGSHGRNYRFSHCSKAAMTGYLKNMSRPCLKFCKGPSCSMKRSMDFLTGPYNIDRVTMVNITITNAGGNKTGITLGSYCSVISSCLLLIALFVFSPF